MRLTKLQAEYIDMRTKSGDFVAFPVSVFKSKAYKEWSKRNVKKSAKHIPIRVANKEGE